MSQEKIISFTQDDQGHFVAILECGHSVHMRHRPPLESRPWILDAEERKSRVGSLVDCIFCDMPKLPPEARSYQRTRSFDQDSVPKGLLSEHRTKADTFGRIVVESGKLLYEIPSLLRSWVLRPGVDGFIAPEQLHRVAPVGEVRFFVEFYRLDG